jgi:hypothetical protein
MAIEIEERTSALVKKKERQVAKEKLLPSSGLVHVV